MTPMWNMLLRSDLPSDLLEDMDYAVFGLGDTAYEKFCWAAKKLARCLESLGAREVCPRGEGDEQHPFGYVLPQHSTLSMIPCFFDRLEGGLDPWIEKLFESLLALYPMPPEREILPADQLHQARIAVQVLEKDYETSESALHEKDGTLWATLKRSRRITSPEWYQDVRHLEFETDFDVEYVWGRC